MTIYKLRFCQVSFNRYMVECELTCIKFVFIFHSVLIDTWWNVNVKCGKRHITNGDVLIDTWWNVNIARSSYINATTLVLIDTWWNVNIQCRN